jgi:hypothetical protein
VARARCYSVVPILAGLTRIDDVIVQVTTDMLIATVFAV